MARLKKAEKNMVKPIERIPEKHGVSYGVIAVAFVAGLLVGVLLTLYKTGGSSPADPHQHVEQKSRLLQTQSF